MYCIENYKSIDKIYLKKANYTVIIGDNSNYLKEICEAIYCYFNEKKITSDKKMYITDKNTGEKEQISSKEVIFLENNELNTELELGSKTILYSKILAFFKEKMPIEPSLITLNTLLENFSFDNVAKEFQNRFTEYSEYKLEFLFELFTPTDIVKKINFNFFKEDIEEKYENISNIEKLKIKLSIFDSEITPKEKIYVFYYPENNFTAKEISSLKIFLYKLSLINNVIVVTSSKYLLDEPLDSLNIIIENTLINGMLEEEIICELIEEYPLLPIKEEILHKLRILVRKNIIELILKTKITNKKENDNFEYLYLDSEEEIFLILYYLKKMNYPYEVDLDFKEHCVFSNYIKKNF